MPPPSATPPAPSTSTIVGQGSGKCLDDRGNPANGIQQYIWTCTAGNANQQYTYDFDGVSEVLDHILITKGIGEFTYQVVHVNSEFANQVSDHDPQVVDIKP